MKRYLNLKPIRLVFVCISLISAPANGKSSAGTGNDIVRVLFIGNSYTYYNNMPQLFEAMAENRFPGRQIITKFMGGGGATLKQHWETSKAVKEIRSGEWDYVVLQEQSMLSTAITENGELYFGSPNPFFEYARKFNRAIRQSRAETVFYMTWSRRDYMHQQKYLTYAYMSIARELNSRVAPAGMAWNRVRGHKSIELYQRDGSHPSAEGSFLAAVSLLAVIFDVSPKGIPGRLEGHEILPGGKLAKEKSVLCDLSEKDVEIILEAVSEVYEKMKRSNSYIEVKKAVSHKTPSLVSQLLNPLRSAKGQITVLAVLAVAYLIARFRRRFL